MSDGRAVFLVDLHAADHAPLKSHPVRFQLRVALQRPRPDGLRADDEADAMYALEDRVVSAVERALSGIYVGRYTAGGNTTFVFYLSEDAEARAEEMTVPLGDISPYVAEWGTAADPDWSFFTEILMPSEYSRAEISNRRLLSRMQQLGDQLEAPREIEHFAYFEELEHAARAAAELRRHGFAVDDLAADDEGNIGVKFRRVDHCAGGRADEIAYEVLDIVLAERGDYDGWGAPLVKAEEA